MDSQLDLYTLRDEQGRLNEQTFNVALAAALRRCRSGWRNNETAVLVERSHVLVENKAGRPDLLLDPGNSYPIAIECEYGDPAIDDAVARLGERFSRNMLPIRSAIAVGIPNEVEWWTDSELEARLATLDGIALKIVVVSADVRLDSTGNVVVSDEHRWPSDHQVTGDVRYLAEVCEDVVAPPSVVESHAETVAEHLRGFARGLEEAVDAKVGWAVAHALGQDSVTQGIRLACCIWLTSLRLQDALAEIPETRRLGVRKFAELRSGKTDLVTLSELRDVWRGILEINYKSIFVPALNALDEGLPSLNGAEVLDGLAREAEGITALRLGNSVDFAGELFPKLLDDREETAAHYTLPTTAHLLAQIAVDRIPVKDWRSTDEVGKLRLADFACGTGTLLRAAYKRIRHNYEVAGGEDLAPIHEIMLERGITGTDINALAAHMTAALSSFEMGQTYRETNIGAIPIYGGTTGALEFLMTESFSDIVGESVVQSDSATNGGATIGAPNKGYDLVIQNPPYTSPVAGERGRKMFDVAGVSEQDRQTAIAKLRSHRKAIAGNGVDVSHGRAGLGADFSALADIKLRSGGIFATVLPLTAAHSTSWENFRAYLEQHYYDLTAIAFTTDSHSMMSADTNLNEMLFIATKAEGDQSTVASASDDPKKSSLQSLLCVNLRRHPESLNDASVIVREIKAAEASMATSGAIRFAGLQIGDWARFPVFGRGFPWAALGLRDRNLSSVMCNLFAGTLKFDPEGMEVELDLPMVGLGSVVEIGPTHGQIGHIHGSTTGRGAFVFHPIETGDAPSYPALWSANACRQRRMIVEPTHEGTPIEGRSKAFKSIRKKRSNTFISQDMRFTSQSLVAARTKALCLGSATWTVMRHADNSVLDALVIWLNSTLGMLMRTGYGNTSQRGRARIAIRATADFPIPNFAEDSDAGERARLVAVDHFDRLAELKLKPAAYAWQDKKRHEIDWVVLDMLGIDSPETRNAVERIRELWCREPAVHGGNRKIMKALGIGA